MVTRISRLRRGYHRNWINSRAAVGHNIHQLPAEIRNRIYNYTIRGHRRNVRSRRNAHNRGRRANHLPLAGTRAHGHRVMFPSHYRQHFPGSYRWQP